MRSIGVKGQTGKEFQLPSGLTTDRINQVYCVDYGSSLIYVFNKSGQFIRCFGARALAPAYSTCLAQWQSTATTRYMSSTPSITASRSLVRLVIIFILLAAEAQSQVDFLPCDFSIDTSNHILYVADKGNHRIQVFELSNT